MKRAIIFDKDDNVTATVLPVTARCLGRPKCMIMCDAVPDFENQGGLMIGDTLVLHIQHLGIWEDYTFLGKDGAFFVFGSTATW
jgi:hypothetical protein